MTWLTKLNEISGMQEPDFSDEASRVWDEIVAVIEAAEDIDANTGIWYVTDDRAALKKAMTELNGSLAALRSKVEGAEAP